MINIDEYKKTLDLIKDKYNVEKVYPPSGLEIHEVATYRSDVKSALEIYEDIKDLEANLLPVGTIIPYAGNSVPNGFLDCSGASLNPATYVNLFGV